jgi:methionyl-tRNA formyltransferase
MRVMDNLPTSARVCFIGGHSRFSYSAFRVLCQQGINITQVILAGHGPAAAPGNTLPVAVPVAKENALQQLAHQQRIPVHFLGQAKNRLQQWQQICAGDSHLPKPDFVFVACFPEKLPDVLLHWPHRHSINLHPSLLPKYRGPDPVFWQLQNHEQDTGISLHLLTETLDAGPVFHQQAVTYPDDTTRSELDTLLAQQGALAFAQLLSHDTFVATPQDESQASYQPLPAKDA